MRHIMLITIRHERSSRTLSFDAAQQTLLWLSVQADAESGEAPARIEAGEKGLLLRPSAPYVVRVPGRADPIAGPVMLDERSVVMIGLQRVGADTQLSVYLRPARTSMEVSVPVLFLGAADLVVGSERSCDLRYRNPYVSARHARFRYRDGRFLAQDLGSGNGTFVNGQAIDSLHQRWLRPGDVVEILDLVAVVGRGFLLTNDLEEVRVLGSRAVRRARRAELPATPVARRPALALPRQFYPAPWLTMQAHEYVREVDAPPDPVPADERPLLVQLGPSLFMGMGSLYLISHFLVAWTAGEDVASQLPSLCMAAAMLGATIVWPLVSRAYERRRARARDARRKERYVAYLDALECDLRERAEAQAHALESRQQPIGAVLGLAHEVSPLLMSRTQDSEDFLCLRVGMGDASLAANVSWPERHFSLKDDALWDRMLLLRDDAMRLRRVPLTCDMAAHAVTGIVGPRSLAWEFLRGLLVQLCALHSYGEVRLVLIVDQAERVEWEPFSTLAHVDGTSATRCVCLTNEGVERLDRELRDEGALHMPHTVVVCAHPMLSKRSRTVQDMLSPAGKEGFSALFLGEHLHDLPRECAFIVDLMPPDESELRSELLRDESAGLDAGGQARMFVRSDVSGTLQSFEPDIMVSREQARQFSLDVARVRLATVEDAHAIPESVGFLELYAVGNAAHLNVGKRWHASDAARSLACPVGVDGEGNVVQLDLHEAADGPHGLIAGTTGSGKSELVMALVLSLAVNFSPDEVAFLLIDYKGGGLAGAFVNERQVLPHVAGTITNLDGRTIRRALVSLRSELTRRQQALNEVRDRLGESSVDIYRYLSLYRQGLVDTPIPHLFVIADEFAELKQQEPQFMDELISAARIGRSLGVHLVLATQKPSGVVNDQIWSNARCKISLKVSDAADSREMIRRDDAALLRRPGAFYLLVGYDERALLGQAAYAGGAYVAHERYLRRRDTMVELLDAEGQVVARAHPAQGERASTQTELGAVVDEITRVAIQQGRRARRLWLNPLGTHPSLEVLRQRYDIQATSPTTCLVGEFDDPAHQATHPFVVDFAQVGNVVVYGEQTSDAEGLVRTMLIGLAQAASAHDLWIYAADWGRAGLRVLSDLPHVGGMVCADDDEQRIEQAVRLLERLLASRRAAGSKDVPAPVVIMVWVQLPALVESHPELEDRIAALVRDGAAFRMHSLATADGPASVHVRLRSSFGMVVPTTLNDPSDYAYALSTMVQQLPSRMPRRGLARFGDDILEFQGAFVGEKPDGECAALGKVVESRRLACTRDAPAIPQLPEAVTWHVMGAAGEAPAIPVGFAQQTVEPVYLHVERSSSVLVVGNDLRALVSYTRGMCACLAQATEQIVRVFDPREHMAHANDDLFRVDGEGLRDVLHAACDVLVVVDAVPAFEALPHDVRDALERRICAGSLSEGPAFVLVSEAWRLTALFDDWYRAASSQGQGVWVADGFEDQAVFRMARLAARHRGPTAANGGFAVQAGNAWAVRLLEPAGGGALA